MSKILMLSEKIRNAKYLDFGTVLNEIIETFKKVWVQGILLFLFSMIVMLPIIILVYVPLISVSLMHSQNGSVDTEVFSEMFAGASIMYVLLLVVLFLALAATSTALIAGFYRIVKTLDEEGSVSVSDFFCFFNLEHLTKMLLLSLITILIAVGSALLCYLPLFYTMVPISFFSIIFAFNPEESVGDIVKIGFQLGTKKWGISFGLMLLIGISVMILSFLTCGIGNLFLISLSYLPVYVIYKNVIGFESDDKPEAIETVDSE
ncbi:hypothetical protein WH52_12000 [Tenacibaculum holothuriorum]|uniref:Glycerophosphoryl diester phosphodiesterase membrane domain-containing protein n=1 Tax=Tenacibaculum holothuriorum TaxID=1635173 RepID=A0A1Y2PAA2_9FLAO|nr:hypothetical protein [Tenacibaculum holothuriorum]OSY87384.1 hypothetical protein WH52_12000 [Tenacibaculum holothuriorum]